MAHDIRIKRAYVEPARGDGYRILVDRIWPRGVKKEALEADLWQKEVAPSDAVRKEFNHEDEKYPAFRKAYRAEIRANPVAKELLATVEEQLKDRNVTLVYGAKNEKHNQAVVLQEWLKEKLG